MGVALLAVMGDTYDLPLVRKCVPCVVTMKSLRFYTVKLFINRRGFNEYGSDQLTVATKYLHPLPAGIRQKWIFM